MRISSLIKKLTLLAIVAGACIFANTTDAQAGYGYRYKSRSYQSYQPVRRYNVKRYNYSRPSYNRGYRKPYGGYQQRSYNNHRSYNQRRSYYRSY